MTSRFIAAIVLAASILVPDAMAAAPKCTRNDIRQLNATLNRVESAVRTFENSKIKYICKAGRRALAEFQKAEKVIKARPKCTLATAADRRSFARVQREIRSLEREYKRGC